MLSDKKSQRIDSYYVRPNDFQVWLFYTNLKHEKWIEQGTESIEHIPMQMLG